MKSLILFTFLVLLLGCAKNEETAINNTEVKNRTSCSGTSICCPDPGNPGYYNCPYNSNTCYMNEQPVGWLAYLNFDAVGPKCYSALKKHKANLYFHTYNDYVPVDLCVFYQFSPVITNEDVNNVVFPNDPPGTNSKYYCDRYYEYSPLPFIGERFSSYDWKAGVDCEDANLIADFINGNNLALPTIESKIAADVNLDGTITMADVQLIKNLNYYDPNCLGGDEYIESFPTTSTLSGIEGLGKYPWAYLNYEAYVWINSQIWWQTQENLTRIAYINEDGATRLVNLVYSSNCANYNIWGSYNTFPYNLGNGKEVFAIKRGDVNRSFCSPF